MAELVAIERTLARCGPGDRVLVLSDCQGAMQAIEALWRLGELGELSGMRSRRCGGLIDASSLEAED